jgi:alpha-glucosidase
MSGVVSGLRRVLDEYADRVMIGEIHLSLDRLMAYYGDQLGGVHLPFNFQLLQTPWDARSIADLIDRYERALPQGGWPNWVLGNHDSPRIASRVGMAQGRVAAMLLLTLRGTPTLYYGDEIGMSNVVIPAEMVQDPLEMNVPGKGLGRDPGRTPMQWDRSGYGGFSSSRPWLPLSDDYVVVNVDTEQHDHSSYLNLYQRLLTLRRSHAALSIGAYLPLSVKGELLAYIRSAGSERMLVALNLGHRPCSLTLEPLGLQGRALLSTHPDREGELISPALELRPDEGLIVALDPGRNPNPS